MTDHTDPIDRRDTPSADSSPAGPSGPPFGASDPRDEALHARLRRLAADDELRAGGNFFGRLRASTRGEWVSTILLATNCAVFAAMVTLGVSVMDPSPDSLVRWGAMVPALTRDGEPWRLFTACFLHVGLIHLAVNMFSLWSLRFVEVWFGHLAFAVAYLVSGLCGSLASTAFSKPHVVSAGASGAIFGLVGAVLGAAIRWRRLGVDSSVTKPIVRGVLQTLVLNGIIALSIRHLDHAAHAGGFLSGIVLGYALAHAPTPAGLRSRARRGWTVAAISIVLVVGAALALRRPGLARSIEEGRHVPRAAEGPPR